MRTFDIDNPEHRDHITELLWVWLHRIFTHGRKVRSMRGLESWALSYGQEAVNDPRIRERAVNAAAAEFHKKGFRIKG
jgi:hypothetical protein